MFSLLFNIYDFPGCISAGETLEEAKIMATEALNGHINLMIADGDEIPSPSTLETILSDPEHQEAIAFMRIEVSASLSGDRDLCIS